MTLNALGGIAVPTSVARTAPSGKTADADPSGFEDALGGKGTQRKTAADERAGLSSREPSWGKDSYGKSPNLDLEKIVADDAIRLPVDVDVAQEAELQRELSLDEILELVAGPTQPEPADPVAAQADIPTNLIKSVLGETKGNGIDGTDDTTLDADALSSAQSTDMPADAAPVSKTGIIAAPAVQTGLAIANGSQQTSNGRAAGQPPQHVGTPPNGVVNGDGDNPAPARPAAIKATPSAETVEAPRQQIPTPASGSNDPFAGKVNVLGISNAPAPSPVANAQLSLTSAGVVAALESEPTWRQAAADPALSPQPRTPATISGVNSLRIQLNPAELGMVTARLTAAGSQLSIEIQVESNDARQKLSSESDAILKALRAIGFDVEKVTIQQSSPNTQSQQQAQSNSSGREHFQADQQAGGDADTRGQGGQDSTGRGERGPAGQGDTATERAGSDVYI